jgi:hypothetical protein
MIERQFHERLAYRRVPGYTASSSSAKLSRPVRAIQLGGPRRELRRAIITRLPAARHAGSIDS